MVVFRGAEPKQLAVSAALGISLGVFPIVGMLISLYCYWDNNVYIRPYFFIYKWYAVTMVCKTYGFFYSKAVFFLVGLNV